VYPDGARTRRLGPQAARQSGPRPAVGRLSPPPGRRRGPVGARRRAAHAAVADCIMEGDGHASNTVWSHTSDAPELHVHVRRLPLCCQIASLRARATSLGPWHGRPAGAPSTSSGAQTARALVSVPAGGPAQATPAPSHQPPPRAGQSRGSRPRPAHQTLPGPLHSCDSWRDRHDSHQRPAPQSTESPARAAPLDPFAEHRRARSQ
jgi:hypothetical protein